MAYTGAGSPLAAVRREGSPWGQGRVGLGPWNLALPVFCPVALVQICTVFRGFSCEELKLLKGKRQQKEWTTYLLRTEQLTQTFGKGWGREVSSPEWAGALAAGAGCDLAHV